LRKILVGGGWKMNKTVDESISYAKRLLRFVNKNSEKLKEIEVFILPTFLALYSFSKILKGSKLKYGAQNCFWADEGAYTGEVSPMHLKNIGCTFVELGHPERLNILGENEEMINMKINGALKNNLTPILCIGEERKYSKKTEVYDFLIKQVRAYFKGLYMDSVKKVILAYEPVWAIGADRSAPVEYISDSLDFLRNFLDTEYGKGVGLSQLIFYGGSVNPASAFEILKLKNNNGIFIGRASLDYDYFTNMVNMAVEARAISG
jgi:triosephosphate isomerase